MTTKIKHTHTECYVLTIQRTNLERLTSTLHVAKSWLVPVSMLLLCSMNDASAFDDTVGPPLCYYLEHQ